MKNQAAGRFVALAILAGTVALTASCSDSDDVLEPSTDSLPIGAPDPDNGDVSMPSPTIDAVPQVRNIPAVGGVFTNDDGLSLYVRFVDDPGVVSCDSSCEQTWPPLLTEVTTPGISDPFDVIERDDGAYQWTLDGYPLYTYTGDAAPDETNGNGIDEQWALARPVPVTSADLLAEEGLVSAGSTLADGSSDTRLDRTGHTLYFFADDTAGSSVCNDGCATAWPPLYADTGAVDRDRYSVITRADGTTQWAYDGMALYFFEGDTAPAQTNGDSVDGWSVARP
jgi:predicted lipoprotein with Yx(FWY)xxD motif